MNKGSAGGCGKKSNGSGWPKTAGCALQTFTNFVPFPPRKAGLLAAIIQGFLPALLANRFKGAKILSPMHILLDKTYHHIVIC